MGRFQVPDERNGTSVQGQNSRFGRGEFCTRPAKDIHNHPEGERERGGEEGGKEEGGKGGTIGGPCRQCFGFVGWFKPALTHLALAD